MSIAAAQLAVLVHSIAGASGAASISLGLSIGVGGASAGLPGAAVVAEAHAPASSSKLTYRTAGR
jgi:hypothetical protein